MEYKEIFKLKCILEEENIPFRFVDNSMTFKGGEYGTFQYYRIYVPSFLRKVISVVQGSGSKGGTEDLLEITGLLTEEERIKHDGVLGGLTSEQVFERIQKYYLVHKSEERKCRTQKYSNLKKC